MGRIYGTPGGGLQHAETWAKNQQVADLGREGELRTAQILNQKAATPSGPTIIHDIMIPGLDPKYRANIDHLIIADTRILILDSKVWKPGTYWTVFSKSFRGLTRVPHLDKQTMLMGRNGVTKFLDTHRLDATIVCLVAAWSSSSQGQVNTVFARMPGANIIPAVRLDGWLDRHGFNRPANPLLEGTLAQLVHNPAS